MRGVIGSFPETFATYDTRLLLSTFERGPARLESALAGLDAEHFNAYPLPDKWSINEIVLHMADSELVGATRFRLTLGGMEPQLPRYDQDEWCRRLNYSPWNRSRYTNTLHLFRQLRATTLILLHNATVADWSRMGLHVEFGGVTVRNLLELYADHGERHIAQIVARRALLGVPIELPPLLPDLLY